MPGPSKRLEAGQQDELVGTAAAARAAGGESAVRRCRGEFASQVGQNFLAVVTVITGVVLQVNHKTWCLKQTVTETAFSFSHVLL